MKKTILSAFLFFVFSIASAEATTWYVGKSGSDGNNCLTAQSSSAANRKLSVAGGLQCMKDAGGAGHTVVIGDGTYVEAISYTQLNSGTSDSNRNTIKGENSRGAIIKPANCNVNNGFGVAYILGKSFLTFDGFVIDGDNCGSGTDFAGFHITSLNDVASTFLNFFNIEIRATRDTCITAGGSTALPVGYIVRNSEIHDCARAGQQGVSDHGIYFRGRNHLIEHNEVYDVNFGYGIHQHTEGSGSQGDNIIRFNYVHHIAQGGLLMGSGDDNIAHHNIVHDAFTGIRIIQGTPQNNQIYQNTFFDNSGPCMEIGSSSAGAHDTKVKNNLCLSNANNTIAISALSSGTVTVGNVFSTTNSILVDPVNGRFSPSESGASTLVDTAAAEIIAGFSAGKYIGTKPDVGALEAPIFDDAFAEGDGSYMRLVFEIASQSNRGSRIE